MSFARKFGDKYRKILMGIETKAGINSGKTASERAVQKTGEAIGDLIGNKIADKITWVGKSRQKDKKNKEKDKTNKAEEIYIPPEKRKQI